MNDYRTKETKSSFRSIRDTRKGYLSPIFRLPIGLRIKLFEPELFKHFSSFSVSTVHFLRAKVASYHSVKSKQGY